MRRNMSGNLGLYKYLWPGSVYDGIKSILQIRVLPKLTTSILLPSDQGVILSLEANYRVKLSHLLLNKEARDVSLYEGLMMIRSAWELNVSGEVIKNAWRQSGLLSHLPGQYARNS